MKTILYFILSVLVIVYVAVLCMFNILGEATVMAWETWGTILKGIADYGGVALVFFFALVNFFCSPLQVVFFVLLTLVIIIYILTCTIPSFFQGLFGIGGGKEGAEALAQWINF